MEKLEYLTDRQMLDFLLVDATLQITVTFVVSGTRIANSRHLHAREISAASN
jgi:hypothetical protein